MNTLLSVNTIVRPLLTATITVILLVSIGKTVTVHAAQDELNTAAQLSVTPKPCVALRKGQTCYLEVTFTWQHPKVGNYCLVNATTNHTLQCWEQHTKGEFNFDFQATMSNDFALRTQASTTDLVSTTIPVAWVYQSSKRAKSTWRLF